MKPRCYRKANHGQRPKLAAWDVETDGLGGRVLACSFMTEDMPEPIYLHKGDFIQELFYFMCEHHEYTWFAHNAQYDLRYLIDRLETRMDDLGIYLRTDNDVFMITLSLPEYGEDAKLVLRDSLALFPLSLRQFGSVFVPELPKGEIDVSHFNPTNQEHIDYCKRDTLLLLLCLRRLHDLVEHHFDIVPATTTASTALRGWQRTLGKTERYYDALKYEPFIRSSYYGGLVFLTDTNIHHNATSYDVNSSYPYQMETYNFPIGNPINTKLLQSGKHGIYRVTVRAPDDIIVPILPARHKGGIVWCKGQFETTVTSIELEFALQNGYRLFQIHGGIYWEETASPFRDFILKCKELRVQHKGSALETVAKLMQNSLYGKFGARRQRRKILAHYTDEETFAGEMWGDYLMMLEEDGEMMTLPQWATFITAHARLHLLRAIYAIGPSNVLYGDTDSITIKQGHTLPPDEIGTAYGQWKPDKKWQTFRARAPKVYAGYLDNGIIKGAIKGIPKSKWQLSGMLEAVYAGEQATVKYETLDSFVLYLKGVRKPSYEAKRSLSDIANSKSWKAFPDGRVRPRDFASLDSEERLRAPQPFQLTNRATA